MKNNKRFMEIFSLVKSYEIYFFICGKCSTLPKSLTTLEADLNVAYINS